MELFKSKNKIDRICRWDNIYLKLYKNNIIPTFVYNILRHHNHKSFSEATGEKELLYKLTMKYKKEE